MLQSSKQVSGGGDKRKPTRMKRDIGNYSLKTRKRMKMGRAVRSIYLPPKKLFRGRWYKSVELVWGLL